MKQGSDCANIRLLKNKAFVRIMQLRNLGNPFFIRLCSLNSENYNNAAFSFRSTTFDFSNNRFIQIFAELFLISIRKQWEFLNYALYMIIVVQPF